jgi:hypothetical protein
MNRLKDWLQRGEMIMVVGAGVIVLVANTISEDCRVGVWRS